MGEALRETVSAIRKGCVSPATPPWRENPGGNPECVHQKTGSHSSFIFFLIKSWKQGIPSRKETDEEFCAVDCIFSFACFGLILESRYVVLATYHGTYCSSQLALNSRQSSCFNLSSFWYYSYVLLHPTLSVCLCLYVCVCFVLVCFRKRFMYSRLASKSLHSQ